MFGNTKLHRPFFPDKLFDYIPLLGAGELLIPHKLLNNRAEKQNPSFAAAKKLESTTGIGSPIPEKP